MNQPAHKTAPRNHTKHAWFSPLSFTGKEKDEETGYGYLPQQVRQAYHGARYMDHELMTSFISVDRYASKYPFISPYAYCAWNPIGFTDLSGDTLKLEGDSDLVRDALNEMQKRTNNLHFNIDNDGIVSYTGGAVSEEEEYIKMIIDHTQIKVDILLQEDEVICNDKVIGDGGADAFLGNNYSNKKNKVNAKQIVNMRVLKNVLDQEGGNLIWHAIAECYEGALFALKRGRSVSYSDISDFNYCYNISHNNANLRFCGNIFIFGFEKNIMMKTLDL